MTRESDAPDRELSALLQRMGTLVVPLEDGGVHSKREDELVPSLSRFAREAFVERDRARRRRYVWLALAAFVTTLGAAVFFVREMRRQPPVAEGASVIVRDGAVQAAGDSLPSGAARALRTTDKVETLAGHAEVALASGASVALDAMTRVELEAQSRVADVSHERLALFNGRIAVRVPKLGRGSLVIDTPDAKVTVHGTRFSVDVRPATGEWSAETRVAVSEGLVSVLSGGHEVFLEPGARWSSAASPTETAAPEAVVTAAASSSPSTPSKPAPKSSLAEETDLFRAALRARQKGDDRGAVELVNRLLTRYPASPLATDARAERDRALADLQRTPP